MNIKREPASAGEGVPRPSRARIKWGVLALTVGALLAMALVLRQRAGHSETSLAAARDQHATSLAVARFQRRDTPAHELGAGFAGRVFDVRGAGVAQALVCAACANCEPSSAPESVCAHSQADGAYALEQLPAAGYYVSAVADNHMPGSAFDGAAVYLAADEQRAGVDIALSAGGAQLSGHVLDATGGPIALAKLRALRLTPPRVSVDLLTDAAGRFDVSLPPGPLQVIAQADGYAPGSKNLVAPNADVSIKLVPASSIRGAVFSTRDGRPIPGIEVRALPGEQPGVTVFRSGVSDDQGRFSISGLEPGTYVIVAKGERWHERYPTPVEVALAGQRDGVRITLDPGAAISGKVVTTNNNQPCRTGFVSLTPVRGQGAEPSLTGVINSGPQLSPIQADGSVFFPGTARGKYAVTVRCNESFVSDEQPLLEIGDEDVTDAVWRVTAGVDLEITVVDRSGRPAPGAPFNLMHPGFDGRPSGVMTLMAGSDGRMRVPGLKPGTYGVGPHDGENIQVELRNGERQRAVKVTLPASGMIELKVVTNRNTPLDGVNVSLLKFDSPLATSAPVFANTQPRGAGVYAIGPIAAGRYVIRVADEANPPVEIGRTDPIIQVTEGITRAQVVLPRAGKIEGRVVDDHGEPVPNVWVHATSESDRTGMERLALMMSPSRILTDAQGSFTLANLADAAHYTLRVEEPSGSVAQQSGVQPGQQVTITLSPSAAISGNVLAADGSPAQRYTLTATHLGTGATRQVAVMHANGRFELSGVTPGTVALEVTGDSGQYAQSTVQIAAGKQVSGLRLAYSSPNAAVSPAQPQPPAPPAHGGT